MSAQKGEITKIATERIDKLPTHTIDVKSSVNKMKFELDGNPVTGAAAGTQTTTTTSLSSLTTNGTNLKRSAPTLQLPINIKYKDDVGRAIAEIRGQVPPKKVYLPNLNVTRNKNGKVDVPKDATQQQTTRGRGRGRGGVNLGNRGGGRGGRGGGRGGKSHLIQTQGVFSEGVGPALLKRKATMGIGGLRRSRGDDGECTMSKFRRIHSEEKLGTSVGKMNSMDYYDDWYTRRFKNINDDYDIKSNLLLNDGTTEKLLPPVILSASRFGFKEKCVDNKDKRIEADVSFQKKKETAQNCAEDLSGSKVKIKIDSNDEANIANGSNGTQTKTQIDPTYYPASFTELLDSKQAQLFVMQLPETLPCDNPDVYTKVINESILQKTTPKVDLRKLEKGLIGHVVRYKSGKTKLQLGDISYGIDMALDFNQHEDLMSLTANVEERNASLIKLGPIQAKLVCQPDFFEVHEKYTKYEEELKRNLN